MPLCPERASAIFRSRCGFCYLLPSLLPLSPRRLFSNVVVSVSMCVMIWFKWNNNKHSTRKYFLLVVCVAILQSAEYVRLVAIDWCMCTVDITSDLAREYGSCVDWIFIIIVINCRMHFWRLFMLFDFYCVSAAPYRPQCAMRFSLLSSGCTPYTSQYSEENNSTICAAAHFPHIEFSASGNKWFYENTNAS